jgi:hypothetical protein
MRGAFALLVAAVVATAAFLGMARDPTGPSRDSAGPPAAEDPAKTPPEERESRRELVLAAVRGYAELVQESGGAAACRLFPDHFEPTGGEPVEPPAPDVPYPHPAPADGCKSRELTGFTQIPSAPWESSTIERIGRVRFVRGLARVTLRIRTQYGPTPQAGRTPDVLERDVVWLRPGDAAWHVARPSLLTYRVFESRGTPRDIVDRPVPAEGLSRPVRLPAANLGCPAPKLTVSDPAGAADRQAGLSPAPWVDMTRLTMARARGTLCLTIRTRAPLRPSTRFELYAEQPSRSVVGTFASIRLDTLGRPRVTTHEPPLDAGSDLGAPYRFHGARVGGRARRISIALPVKRLRLERGRFAWMLKVYNEPSPGKVHYDQAPNTRLRLFYTYPDGKLVRELPRN